VKPILIMSSERSGSNLLRRMLAEHPSVVGPPPPHLWRHLAEIAMDLPDLEDEGDLDALIGCALSLTRVGRSHLCWKHELTASEVRDAMRARSLSGVVGATYAAYARRERADACVIKENRLWEHAHRIRAVYPETRVIYLFRDGRDVACSVKRVPSHDQHITYIAREWREEQRRARLVYADLRAAGVALRVGYEALIEEPEATLRALCAFLDLAFVPSMLAFHTSAETRTEASKTRYWENLATPVQSDNRDRFRNELSAREIALFESIAGDQLELLGYALAAAGPLPRPGRLARLAHAAVNAWHRRRQRAELLREPGRRERVAVLRSLREAVAERRAARAIGARSRR
jgi:hypothetical protein